MYRTLATGSPIIADIVWRLADEGPGHFMVIYGIDVEQKIFLPRPLRWIGDGSQLGKLSASMGWPGRSGRSTPTRRTPILGDGRIHEIMKLSDGDLDVEVGGLL